MKSMTKEEIITGLKAAVKPEEEYFIEDDLIDAINQYPEPFELVEPILEIIATNPQVDFGMPGDLVHFVEQFYKHGYEELLIASVRNHPTPYNIWMVHRCYNDTENPKREKFAELMRNLKNDSSVSVGGSENRLLMTLIGNIKKILKKRISRPGGKII